MTEIRLAGGRTAIVGFRTYEEAKTYAAINSLRVVCLCCRYGIPARRKPEAVIGAELDEPPTGPDNKPRTAWWDEDGTAIDIIAVTK